MSTPDPLEKRSTIGTKSRKVACVATLTAAGLSFGLVPSASAAPQKVSKAQPARSDSAAEPGDER